MHRTLLALTLLLFACGGKSDDDSASTNTTGTATGGGGGTPATCEALCTDFGYDSHTEDDQPYEYHCVCAGDAGTDVDPTVCNDFCLQEGWSGGYVEPGECWCA
ncbi:MAG: hypothetical protein ACI8PZ_005787 [Myxococcota bacterium]|jgi:hypothetical protein